MNDLTGQKFNSWTVLGFSHKKGNYSFWLCLCDCGRTTRAILNSTLTTGVATKCILCSNEERIGKFKLTDQESGLHAMYQSYLDSCHEFNLNYNEFVEIT